MYIHETLLHVYMHVHGSDYTCISMYIHVTAVCVVCRVPQSSVPSTVPCQKRIAARLDHVSAAIICVLCYYTCCIHVLMRDEKEGRKKQTCIFKMYMYCIVHVYAVQLCLELEMEVHFI